MSDRVEALFGVGKAEETISKKSRCLLHISQYLKLGPVFGVAGNCRHKGGMARQAVSHVHDMSEIKSGVLVLVVKGSIYPTPYGPI